MKKLLLLLLAIALIFISKNILSSIQALSKGKNIYIDLKKETEDKKRENEFLKQKFSYVKTNEFIEKEAREKLGLVKEGEYIIQAPPQETSDIQKEPRKIPNWKKWWELFF